MDNIQQNIQRANLKKKNIARLVLYSELSKYYTMEEIDQMLATISEGGFVDLRSYLKKSEVDSQLSATSELPVQNKVIYEQLQRCITERDLSETLENYQQKLVSGENIKTINNQSILGEGNIDIQGGGGVEQIQSDWAQEDDTQKDYIKHKPEIPDVSDYYTKDETDGVVNAAKQELYGAIDQAVADRKKTRYIPFDLRGESIIFLSNEDMVELFGTQSLFDITVNQYQHVYRVTNSKSEVFEIPAAYNNANGVRKIVGINGNLTLELTFTMGNSVYMNAALQYRETSIPAISYDEEQDLEPSQQEQARENIGIDLDHIADLDNSGKLPKGQLPEGVVTEYAIASDIESLFSQPEQQEISGEHAGEISNGEVIGDTPIRDN